MKAARKTAASRAEIVDVPVPEVAPDGALVRVRACAICASDVPGWLAPVAGGGSPGEWDADNPGLTGHEIAGELTVVGRNVDPARVGERVWIDPIAGCGHCEECRQGRQTFCPDVTIISQGFAEYVACPAHQCRPIPLGLDFETASLIPDMAGTPIGALNRALVKRGEVVAVWGLGPVGLGLAQAALMKGGSPVIGVDPVGSRRRRAGAFGVTALDPSDLPIEDLIRRATGGRAPDVVLCSVSNDKAVRQAFDMLRNDGRMVTVAGFPPAGGEVRKWVSGTWGCDERLWPEVLDAIQTEQFRLDGYITHRFALRDIEEAFSTRANDLEHSFKVVVTAD